MHAAKAHLLRCRASGRGSFGPALAAFPGQDHAVPLQYPGAPKPVCDDSQTALCHELYRRGGPEPGVSRTARWMFFPPSPASQLYAAFSGGVDGGGAMFRLQVASRRIGHAVRRLGPFKPTLFSMCPPAGSAKPGKVGHGLQSRSGRRDRQCRAGNAERPGRAPVPGSAKWWRWPRPARWAPKFRSATAS